MTLERSVHSKRQFPKFAAVMEEYMQLGHAELVPVADQAKRCSTCQCMQSVFDASAKTSTGVSLNDILLCTLH